MALERKYADELIATAKAIGAKGKGILAADESTGTMGKRLTAIGLENEEENRCFYRSFLFRSEGIEKYISGVILFEETLFQKTTIETEDGEKIVDVVQALKDAGKKEEKKDGKKDAVEAPEGDAEKKDGESEDVEAPKGDAKKDDAKEEKHGVILGIKVDQGTRKLPFSNDLYTQGLTDLDKRCKKYYEAGCRFAKWRAVLKIVNGGISPQSINETAVTLARYAAICQDNGLAPIVEPEILMDGAHDLATCQYWTEKTLAACYKALNEHNVLLEGSLLKPNMVLPGADNKDKDKVSSDDIAKATVDALRRTVPAAVPAICFLSGGQSEDEATRNLAAVNKYANEEAGKPWHSLTFSYGRALQKSCLAVWGGDPENVKEAQKAFIARAEVNGLAQQGEYKYLASVASKKSLHEPGRSGY